MDEILKLTDEEAIAKLEFGLGHVGINAECEEQALAIAQLFETCFGFKVKNGNSSVFAGKEVEIMKRGGKGKMGHIAVTTADIKSAVVYFESKGYEFDEESRAKAMAGTGPAAFFKADFGGFAVHLLQRK